MERITKDGDIIAVDLITIKKFRSIDILGKNNMPERALLNIVLDELTKHSDEFVFKIHLHSERTLHDLIFVIETYCCTHIHNRNMTPERLAFKAIEQRCLEEFNTQIVCPELE